MSKSTNKTTRKTAGELSNKAMADTTKYDAKEVALAVCDDLEEQLYLAAQNYDDKIDEKQFCIVMVIAEDPLIKNMKRRKFYCWPWLPSPRPNQSVFLYDKAKQKIIKRLWVLPNALTMAELATSDLVAHNQYETMKDWSVAFYKGTFWDFIRYQHGIDMMSQEEMFEKEGLKGSELIDSKSDQLDSLVPESFDFSKIRCGDVLNPAESVSN